MRKGGDPVDRKVTGDELNFLLSVFILTWAVVEAVNLFVRYA